MTTYGAILLAIVTPLALWLFAFIVKAQVEIWRIKKRYRNNGRLR